MQSCQRTSGTQVTHSHHHVVIPAKAGTQCLCPHWTGKRKVAGFPLSREGRSRSNKQITNSISEAKHQVTSTHPPDPRQKGEGEGRGRGGREGWRQGWGARRKKTK